MRTRAIKAEQPKVEPKEDEEMSLVSFFNLYQGFIDTTADLLKDEVEIIKTRKIVRNEAVLKNEKRPEAVRLSKNIVTAFNDAIAKAVKDLLKHSCEMSEELQKRYNLPDDWMQSTSTTVSVAGSEINGPTTLRQRREMEHRIGFLLNETSRSSDISEKSVEKDNLVDNNGLQELSGGSENDQSKDNLVEKESDENKDDEELSSHNEIPENTKSTKKRPTPKKTTPQSTSSTDTSDNDVDHNVDMIPGSEEEIEENCGNKQGNFSPSKSERKRSKVKQEENAEFETPKKDTQESRGSSKKKTTPKKNLSSSSLFEDSDTGSDASGATCIIPTRKNTSPLKTENSSKNHERKSEMDENGKATKTNHSSDDLTVDAATPKKSVSVKREPQPSDEKSWVEEAMDIENESQNENVQLEKGNTSVVDESVDDFMDLLSPPLDDPTSNFGVDLDETMTIMMPRTPVKSKNSCATDVVETKQANQPAESDDDEMDESKLNVEKKLSESNMDEQEDAKEKPKDKDEVNKTNKIVDESEGSDLKAPRVKISSKKSKEERQAMRDILESSSSDSEASSKKRKGNKNQSKKKNKDGTGEEKEIDSKAKTKSDLKIKSWMDDPKLKDDSARVIVEKLSPAIEKSLAQEGYVVLKGYGKLKKCSLKDLIKTDANSGSDSDSSTASNDSVKNLERELKKISRTSIIRTLKYKKAGGTKRGSEKRTTKKKAKGAQENELESCDSDSSNEPDESKSELKKASTLFDDDIVSGSGSGDIDSDSDKSTKRQQRPSRSNPSRNPDAIRKNYKQATLTDSDSESERKTRKELLGSDSDSDNKVKRQMRSRKAPESSDSDSDFKTVKRKTTKKKLKKGSDSDHSLITIDSESQSSDSDFKKTKKSSKRRRDSSSDSNKKRKKKRKRIVTNDSDDSGKRASSDSDVKEVSPDDDEASTSQKGRKNIRKIKSSKELEKTTKKAEKEEEERRKRLADKQKLFNGIHKAPESDKIERLVLDIDPETQEPLIEVDKEIVRRLKPHQAEGIKFMYNACFESVDMIKKNKVPGGCILAHCMGLGKTLQSIGFIHTLLTNEICGIKTALVICPLSTVNNWFNEIRTWTEDATTLKIHKLYEAKNTVASRIDYLKTWHRRGGVGILHYDLFRRLADPKGKAKMKPNLRSVIQESLLDPGPDVVICDEGHLLKNCKSMLSLAVSNIKTHRRIVLTGTPLQNNLVEYHTMMNFVKPNLLGSLPEFTNRFVNPIKNGQHADSTETDVKTMKRRAHVLHRKLEGCVQRCDYSILAPYLPPKYEYIINIKLSEKQQLLYKHYLNNVVDSDLTTRRRNLLKYYAELVKVWSHPIALTMRRSNKDDEEEETSENDSIKDFICDDSSEVGSGEEGSSDGHTKNSKRRTRTQAALDPESDKAFVSLEDGSLPGRGWWNAVFKAKSEMEDLEISGKLVILKEILKTCEAIGDRVLVFSQFLTSLDIIEEFVQDWDKESEANAKKEEMTFPLPSGPQLGRWRRNIEYFRIDGQTKVQDRQRDCDKFNKKSSLSKAKLFLISTRAGGLGINLYGANRVVIFDASWNPSQDMQSIFRVYRFGQDKPCYIYRLIARGTMEEKILRRQITKLSLSSRVVDEHQIERHFKFDDVNEMYVYDEESTSEDTVLAVPKDRLLADLLMSHRELITGYEEFDSLLENKTDEGLTNEEKELAWEEFRIESERQRQYNTNPTTNAASEAETYMKVKTRLVANHPQATEHQIKLATRTALQVIDKIRQLMLIQNSYQPGPPVPGVPGIFDDQLNPLKIWLQNAVSPQNPFPPITGDSILAPLPVAFFRAVGDITQQFPPLIRPPIPRRMPSSFPIQQAALAAPRMMQHMSANFRNIASSTVTGARTYPSMYQN